MAKALDVSKLSQKVSCPICLETLCNPKALVCGHTYCKDCLDRIVTIAASGAASFKCPQGCPQLTKLTAKQTSDDLITNYILKDIIEMTYDEGEGQSDDSDDEDDDENERPISKCSVCHQEPNVFDKEHKRFLCSMCLHRPSAPLIAESSLTRVEYRRHQKELVIVCKKHTSCIATHICCSEYLCVYCAKRGFHRRHVSETLDETELFLKTRIRVERSSRANAYANERADLEREVRKVLKINKLRCLKDYLQVLDEKENSIMTSLAELTSKHIEARQLRNLGDFLNKSGANFLLHRENIVSSLQKLSLADLAPTTALHLSLTKPQFDDPKHPLGVLTSVLYKPFDSSEAKAEPFVNKITADDDLGSVSKSLLCQIKNEVSSCSPRWPMSSTSGSRPDTDGALIYLSISIERFSKLDGLDFMSKKVRTIGQTWRLSLKGSDSNITMEVLSFPPADRLVEATMVVRNDERVYSMKCLRSCNHAPGILPHFLSTFHWNERRGRIGVNGRDCVTFEAFVKLPPPSMKLSVPLGVETDTEDDSPTVGGKRKR